MTENALPKRPVGVTVTTALMVLCLLAEVIDQVSYFYKLRGPYDQPTSDMRGILIIGGYIFLYKTIATSILAFFWRGREWALWAILAEAAFTFASLSRLARGTAFAPQALTPLMGAEALVAAFLLYYLNTRTIRAWFH